MSQETNIQKLREGFAAFENKDLDALGGLFADDIAWHVPGTSPIAGDYKGKEEVFGFFMQTFERSGGTFRIEPDQFLANDTHGVVLVTTKGEREGKTLNSRQAHVFRLNDEGQVAEFWGMAEDTATVSDFWS